MMYEFYYDWELGRQRESRVKAVAALLQYRGKAREMASLRTALRKRFSVKSGGRGISSISDPGSGRALATSRQDPVNEPWFQRVPHNHQRLVDADGGFTRRLRPLPICWYPHPGQVRAACPVHKRAL